MAEIKIPTEYAGKDALSLVVAFNKFDAKIVEDAETAVPVLTLGKDEIFGFVPIAFAVVKNTKNMGKTWAKTFTCEASRELAAEVEQFCSMADAIINGTSGNDTKANVGQIQNYIKGKTFLVNNTFTVADLLVYVAFHKLIMAFTEAEATTEFPDVVRWAIHIQALTASPFPAIPVPIANPWTNQANKNIKVREIGEVSRGGKKGDKKDEKKDAPKGDKKGDKKEAPKAEKKAEKPKKAAAPAPAPVEDNKDPLAYIDIRVAQIVKVWPHPNADSLYCEEIDIGGGVIKKVITGVRNFVPIEEMENRKVVVFTNIKPGKIRGQPSEAMVFAASNSDHTKVELLTPPADCPVGTRVVCGDFIPNPEEVPPVDKKGTRWDVIAKANVLTVNADHEACYRGIPLSVPQGKITVATLSECEFH